MKELKTYQKERHQSSTKIFSSILMAKSKLTNSTKTKNLYFFSFLFNGIWENCTLERSDKILIYFNL